MPSRKVTSQTNGRGWNPSPTKCDFEKFVVGANNVRPIRSHKRKNGRPMVAPTKCDKEIFVYMKATGIVRRIEARVIITSKNSC